MAVAKTVPATLQSVASSKHGKSLDPAQNAHVRKLIRDLLASPQFKGSQTQLAKALGCSQAHVSNIVGVNEVGIGFRLAQRAAELAGVSFEEALNGFRSTLVVELDERYHNRGLAAKAARALEYPEEAIRMVQSVSLKSDHDLSPDEWLDMMRAEKRRLEVFVPVEEPAMSAEEHARQMAELRARADADSAASKERSKAKRSKPPQDAS